VPVESDCALKLLNHPYDDPTAEAFTRRRLDGRTACLGPAKNEFSIGAMVVRPAQPNRQRSVVIAANSPRIGRLERAIRRQLILSKQLATTQLAQRIYRTTKASASTGHLSRGRSAM
jgi:hypothetical protein